MRIVGKASPSDYSLYLRLLKVSTVKSPDRVDSFKKTPPHAIGGQCNEAIRSRRTRQDFCLHGHTKPIGAAWESCNLDQKKQVWL